MSIVMTPNKLAPVRTGCDACEIGAFFFLESDKAQCRKVLVTLAVVRYEQYRTDFVLINHLPMPARADKCTQRARAMRETALSVRLLDAELFAA